jgi:type I restriction enzyme R subunit
MMNAIDNTKNKNGNKLFTPGHFDLIIVDEAHRSIYKKYQAIFEYFDGLVVGLTATPRNDVDRNTYRFFEIENDVPTFAYEYEKAVKEGYLVDYHTIKTSTDFMDRGIKYSELSDEEKEEYENTFADEEENLPEAIDSSAMNSWLFNRDTIKKLLELLMEKGLKVKGGDELGKTIIFARNHNHAEYIVEVFNQLYPQYKGQFAKLIDNQVKYNETIIEDFSVKDKWPQIAVSVDMLDTGVDVPEILNLVFFKPVKSKIKFWQMIGRGTRLCKDLFGVGLDKKEFYIFDYCKNFEFFSENPKGIESNSGISLTERIYGYKLDLIVELQNLKYQNDERYCEYRKSLIKEFVEEINKLNIDSFMVRNNVHYIEQYSKEDNWTYISTIDLADIKDNLIPLFISIEDNEDAKRFDNLIYQLQVKRIRQDKTYRCENSIIDTVAELEKLGTIPQVREKQELILKVAETDYIKQVDFWAIEEVRIELRNLIQFIDPYSRPPVITEKINDTLMEIDEEYVYVSTGNNFSNYRKKLEKFLTGNKENVIIWKIRHNIRLTEQDKENLEKILFEELGNNKEYAEAFGDTNIIKAVRNIVGLDKSVVSDIFYKYINDNRLNMKQIQFVKLLVDYVIKNGTIDMQKLTEQPFKNVGEVYDLFGNNIDLFKEIREDIESINENAEKLA